MTKQTFFSFSSLCKAKEPRLLYYDSQIIVLWKPPRLHTAPLKEIETEESLLGWTLKRFPEIRHLPGRKNVEPGLLYRLDFETSGVVIVARTEKSFHTLLNIQEQLLMEKRYRAYCEPPISGNPDITEPVVIRSRFRPYGVGRRLVKSVPEKTNLNRYRGVSKDIYETMLLEWELSSQTLRIEAMIKKGHRHQIRVCLADLGMPILGDPLYGNGCKESKMHLYARKIAFPYFNDEEFSIEIG